MEAQTAKKIQFPESSQAPKESKRKAALNLYPWRFRNSVQLGVFLLTLGIGFQFFIYVIQASGPGMITVSRPPGVEGFLPIGALLGWKLFLTSGIWDDVHPASMVILGFAGIISFFLRKSFRLLKCFIKLMNNLEFFPQEIGFPNQTIPIRMELIPYFSISFTSMRQTFNFLSLQCWIECSKIS